jgi:hypothetical protein
MSLCKHPRGSSLTVLVLADCIPNARIRSWFIQPTTQYAWRRLRAREARPSLNAKMQWKRFVYDFEKTHQDSLAFLRHITFTLHYEAPTIDSHPNRRRHPVTRGLAFMAESCRRGSWLRALRWKEPVPCRV